MTNGQSTFKNAVINQIAYDELTAVSVTGYTVTANDALGNGTVNYTGGDGGARGDSDGYAVVTQRTVRAASPAAGPDDAANAVSLSVAYADDDDAIPALLRGRPLREEREDGTLLTWEYALDASTLTVTSRRGTAAHPDGLPNVSTYEVETFDAVFGRALGLETRLYTGAAGGVPLASETRSYDARGRLLATTYSDGTTESNVWGCCRLEAKIGRDGSRAEYLSVPGDGHWSAVAETSAGGLPGAGGSHPAVETFTDALGRETGSVRRVWRNGSRDSAYAPQETRTAYPYGTEHYRVTTSPLGVQTVTRKSYGDNCEIGETVSAGVTNRTTKYWGGATVGEEFKTDPVSGEALSHAVRTETSWDANGCEVVTVSVSRNGGAWATESVTRKDFLGRAVVTERAGYGGAMLVTSNAYDTVGRLVYTLNPDGSAVAYAYDELGNGAGTVRIGAGQTLSFDPLGFSLADVITQNTYAVEETPAWKEESDLGLSACGVPAAWWDCSAVVSRTSPARARSRHPSPACNSRGTRPPAPPARSARTRTARPSSRPNRSTRPTPGKP